MTPPRSSSLQSYFDPHRLMIKKNPQRDGNYAFGVGKGALWNEQPIRALEPRRHETKYTLPS